MAETVCDDRPLTLEDLTAWFAAGGKPAADFRVGAEHEKFVFRLGSHAPVPYEGEAGIRALLEGLMRFGWAGTYEQSPTGGETLIGLSRGMANVSLEPGGQFELSGAPLHSMHDICEETGQHLKEVKAVAAELGLGFLGLGFTPIWRRDEVPIMPKGRYQIMRDYMPRVGALGQDMMLRTCTVQANLDFADEADMVAKFRVSLALQPIVTALFANSPFTEGKPNGFLWAGILYDPDAQGAAWDLCKHWTAEDRAKLRGDVARLGLKANVAGRSVQAIAKDMLALADQGLKRRNRVSAGMVDETGYLAELEDIADTGVTAAERLLELYHGPWEGDASRVFEAFAY